MRSVGLDLESAEVKGHFIEGVCWDALKYPLWYIKFSLSCVGQNDLYMYNICNVLV